MPTGSHSTIPYHVVTITLLQHTVQLQFLSTPNQIFFKVVFALAILLCTSNGLSTSCNSFLLCKVVYTSFSLVGGSGSTKKKRKRRQTVKITSEEADEQDSARKKMGS